VEVHSPATATREAAVAARRQISQYDVAFLARHGHTEAAVTHAAARLGLLSHVLASPGISVAVLAERADVTRQAARVLTQVLRVGGALVTDAAGGLHARIDQASLAALDDAAAEAARQWAPLDGAVAALRGDATGQRARIEAAFGSLGADAASPPERGSGPDWLLDRAAYGHIRARVLSTAAELGFLTALADGPCNLQEIAGATDLDRSAAQTVTNALCQLGIVQPHGTSFRLTDSLGELLGDSRSARTFALAADLAHRFWPAFGRLAENARTGVLVLDLQDAEIAARFYLRLAQYNSRVFPGYFAMARNVARGVRELLPGPSPAVLDIGAGSGVWGAAFGHTWPDSRVGFFDRSRVLAQARANVTRLGLTERCWFRAADLSRDSFGDGVADVLILGQVIHTQPADSLPALLQRCRQALKPGGILVIADTVLDPSGITPVDHVYFAVKEMVSTGGLVLNEQECRQLLRSAGFGFARCYRGPGLDVLLSSATDLAFADDLADSLPRMPMAAGRASIQ